MKARAGPLQKRIADDSPARMGLQNRSSTAQPSSPDNLPMATLLITHPSFLEHDTGAGHPERPDRMRAIDKVLAHEMFDALKREEAPLRDDVEERVAVEHPQRYIEWIKHT